MKWLVQEQILQKETPLLGLAACESALSWPCYPLSPLNKGAGGKEERMGREGVMGMAENNSDPCKVNGMR